jgi:hypothetical protein
MQMCKSLAAGGAVALGLAVLLVLPVEQARAHGEVDEEELASFQEHLDDYRQDVSVLVGEVDAIVAAHAAGQDLAGRVPDLIEQWEDVGVHAVIETHATPLYPGVWQGVVALQQAVESDQSTEAVAAAGERLKAALWQGLGAVRLAASQVGTEGAAVVTETSPASGPETVRQIMADLDQAVAAYRADDLARAEALIHETYMTRFEGLEGDLIAHDPDLVTDLERDFNATLPLQMQEGAPLEEIQATVRSMKAQLETASDILASVERSRSEVF